MNRLYIPLAFICGMLFMHSLTGEYSRYGMNIAAEVDDCEAKEQRECDYIIAPVHFIPFSVSPLLHHAPSEIS